MSTSICLKNIVKITTKQIHILFSFRAFTCATDVHIPKIHNGVAPNTTIQINALWNIQCIVTYLISVFTLASNTQRYSFVFPRNDDVVNETHQKNQHFLQPNRCSVVIKTNKCIAYRLLRFFFSESWNVNWKKRRENFFWSHTFAFYTKSCQNKSRNEHNESRYGNSSESFSPTAHSLTANKMPNGVKQNIFIFDSRQRSKDKKREKLFQFLFCRRRLIRRLLLARKMTETLLIIHCTFRGVSSNKAWDSCHLIATTETKTMTRARAQFRFNADERRKSLREKR